MSNIQEVVDAWSDYVRDMPDWHKLVESIGPKDTSCGAVYEPESPLIDRSETFAIADMRDIKVASSHYHANGETEIYFIIKGSGITVVGGEEIYIKKGSVVVTPSNTAHFTIPERDLVMVVINTPSFNLENNIEVHESDETVKFDLDQYKRLTDE